VPRTQILCRQIQATFLSPQRSWIVLSLSRMDGKFPLGVASRLALIGSKILRLGSPNCLQATGSLCEGFLAPTSRIWTGIMHFPENQIHYSTVANQRSDRSSLLLPTSRSTTVVELTFAPLRSSGDKLESVFLVLSLTTDDRTWVEGWPPTCWLWLSPLLF
jgi:hypothetical protein